MDYCSQLLCPRCWASGDRGKTESLGPPQQGTCDRCGKRGAVTAFWVPVVAGDEEELAALRALLISARELYHCEHCARLSGKGIGCMCGPGHRRRVYVLDADAVDGVMGKARKP